MKTLVHSISREIFRMNFARFNEFLRPVCFTSNRFFHTSSLVIRKSRINVLNKTVIFRKYSNDTFRIKSSSCANDVQNEENDDKDEDQDDFYDDGYDNVDENELEENGKEMREEIFKELSQGDPDILKKLKTLEFEIAVLKEQGHKVVNNPTKTQWMELLDNFNKSLNYKTKLLQFMGLNEYKKLSKIKRKKLMGSRKQEKKVEAGFHFYGVSGHTMFPFLSEKSLNSLNALRHLTAKQKILIDCSYQEFMSEICIKNTAKQIQMSIKEALLHRYPCQLAFYNLNQNDKLGTIIQKYVPKIFSKTFYCDVSSQSFLDFYPKDKLVYLSPHSPNELIEFNKDDIYIIGAFVDKGARVKASLAKAKRDKLRMARFPIDQYIIWKQGDKSLPINVVLKILLDMCFYNDWNVAFKSLSCRYKNDFHSRKNLFISDDEFEELE